MRSFKLIAGAAAMALALMVAPTPAVAGDSTIWLHVQVNEGDTENSKVKITLPLSLIEVVIDSADTVDIMKELHGEHGVDIAKLWQQLKTADMDEFVTIESDEADVKVFKEAGTFRVSVKADEDGDEKNVEVRIPFTVMDFIFENDSNQFKLSDLVDSLRGELPLVLVEAQNGSGGEMVKVWLEEK